MKSKLFVAMGLAMLLVPLCGTAQAPEGGYVDVFIAKVKPEKRAEFDAISRKLADANRRYKGDTWLAAETVYGEWNTVYFTSVRRNYADAGQAFENFFGALARAYGGPAGAAKAFQDFNNCVISTRAEIRQRRVDLSRNLPADAAALNKLIGESRWSRTVMVRIRPGRVGDYTAQLKAVNAAFDKAGSTAPFFVSQSASGQQGTIFYLTALRPSLGGFDPTGPSLDRAMSAEDFQKYLKVVQESVLTTETIINRFLPELSNPPEEIAAAAPEFWRPKPMPAARPKPKAGEAAKPEKPGGL